MKTKFKVGDKVKVIDLCQIYSFYSEMAFKLKAKKWVYGTFYSKNVNQGSIGIIKAISKHKHSRKSIALVDVGKLEILISLKGIELVKSTKYIIAFDVQEFTSLPKFKKFLNENKETNGRLFRVSKSYKLKVTTKTRLVKE